VETTTGVRIPSLLVDPRGWPWPDLIQQGTAGTERELGGPPPFPGQQPGEEVDRLRSPVALIGQVRVLRGVGSMILFSTGSGADCHTQGRQLQS